MSNQPTTENSEPIQETPKHPDSEELKQKSIIEIRLSKDKYINSTCQYCKKKQLTYYGVYPDKVMTRDYEILMKRGMIKDGKEYYAANPWESCCKFYNPRTDCINFQISNSQKKAFKKFEQFLNGERNLEGKLKANEERKNGSEKIKENYEIFSQVKEGVLRIFDECVFDKIFEILEKEIGNLKAGRDLRADGYVKQDRIVKGLRVSLIPRLIGFKKGKGKKKAKENKEKLENIKEKILECLILEMKKNKIFENWENIKIEKNWNIVLEVKKEFIQIKKEEENQGTVVQPKKEKKKEIKELTEKEKENKRKTEERIRLQEEGRPEEFTSQWDLKEFKPRKLELRYSKPDFSWEKYDLYNRYNIEIHDKDKHTKSFFEYFICTSMIHREEMISKKDQNQKKSLGTHHMEIYIDDVLIGVSNQDHLKSGITSNYFFYEPAFKNLKLGVISSILEIKEIQKFNKIFPEIRYYYLGTYIHKNSKLKYKSNYRPLEFCCPGTKKWVAFDKKLDELMTDEKRVELVDDCEFDNNGEFSDDLFGYLAELRSLTSCYLDEEKYHNLRSECDRNRRVWFGGKSYVPLNGSSPIFSFVAISSRYFYKYLGKELVKNSMIYL